MAPKYVKVQPSLPVTSIPDAVAYYTERLGFRLAGRDGDNHCWLQLVDDESVGKWDAAVNIYLRSEYLRNTLSTEQGFVDAASLSRTGLRRPRRAPHRRRCEVWQGLYSY